MNLVFIYGPPGVGKFTVATELAEVTGYKLFHNHQSIDAAQPVFTFGDPPFPGLVHRIRLLVFEEAARHGVNMIFTFVYASQTDDSTVASFCEVVERHGGTVQFVQLTCDPEALEHRVQQPGRAKMGKLHNIDLVRELHTQHDVLSPIANRDSLVIDNSDLTPGEAAERIAAHSAL